MKDFGDNVLVIEPHSFSPAAHEPPKTLASWNDVLKEVPDLLRGVTGTGMSGWAKGSFGRAGDANSVCSLFLSETSIMSQDWTTDMRLLSSALSQTFIAANSTLPQVKVQGKMENLTAVA